MLTAILFALLSALTLTSSLAIPPSDGDKINLKEFPSLIEVELEELIDGLAAGAFTSVDLVNAYTARIMEVNSTLHMVTELNPDALAIAAEADQLRAQNKVLSPLHGIPILIKNNIATDDEMNNTAGSWSLLGAKVPRDSTIAAKLRKAGAIILGKTNLSQWANYRSYNTSNGWSAYGGQTYGAYYPRQDPSGSSSGSGVSSSIGLAAAALGTETDGSIVSPSENNNLVGIKPTVGLTSRYLVIPISEHQDTVGPMARYVKDAAYILQEIAGVDPRDNYTSAIPNGGKLPDYVAACDFDAFKGKRIGIPRNVLDIWSSFLSTTVISAFNEAVSQIEAAGATIVDANFTAFKEYSSNSKEGVVLNADFLTNLPQYFSELTYNPNNLTSLASELAFTHRYPLERWPLRDTKVWESALNQSFDNTSPKFWAAYQSDLYYGGPGGLFGALERTNTDAVLLPTVIASPIPAIVGAPIVTVPMGFFPPNTTVSMDGFGTLVARAPNIPFGLSFLGKKWSEADLIGFAYAYEQRTKHRNQVQPYIEPSTELLDIIGGGSNNTSAKKKVKVRRDGIYNTNDA